MGGGGGGILVEKGMILWIVSPFVMTGLEKRKSAQLCNMCSVLCFGTDCLLEINTWILAFYGTLFEHT